MRKVKFLGSSLKSIRSVFCKTKPYGGNFIFFPKKFIYTKNGDKGMSSLYDNNEEVYDKDDLVFNVLGDMDELSSNIGLAREYCKMIKVKKSEVNEILNNLEEVQKKLQKINTVIATKQMKSNELKNSNNEISLWVDDLENEIDKYCCNESLIDGFVLPGGNKSSSQLHVCRSVCRRSERSLVSLSKRNSTNDVGIGEKERVEISLIYMNRLSDYFFSLANYSYKKKEKKFKWKVNEVFVYVIICFILLYDVVKEKFFPKKN